MKINHLVRYGMFSWSTSALLLGGVGGFDLLTPKINKICVNTAGINQTQFIVGISEAFFTNKGVIPWPNTMPKGRDIAKVIVAKVRWLSRNQCWLT